MKKDGVGPHHAPVTSVRRQNVRTALGLHVRLGRLRRPKPISRRALGFVCRLQLEVDTNVCWRDHALSSCSRTYTARYLMKARRTSGEVLATLVLTRLRVRRRFRLRGGSPLFETPGIDRFAESPIQVPGVFDVLTGSRLTRSAGTSSSPPFDHPHPPGANEAGHRPRRPAVFDDSPREHRRDEDP